MDTEGICGEYSDDSLFEADETSQLLTKSKKAPAQSRDLDGLGMIRTLDFWVLFWIMSLRECPRCEAEVC
jgi:hypothetical protein